ncbi:MAG: hypothetical protein PHU07_03725 [Acidocella sp.]|nr:hypothetical protein [Acidocella sp.]
MIRAPQAAIPLLAAGLGLLLTAELLLPGPTAPPPRASPAIPAAAPDDAADAATSQWADTILARPLFNADRRPVQEAGANTALPRLSAIIVTDGVRSAIFSATGQKPQVVGEGGEIGGYRIEAIAPDEVKLAGPGGLLTLHPQFVTAAPPAATPPANAPNPIPLSNDPI